MSTTKVFSILVILISAVSFVLASDPEPLQDLCVALPSSGVKVNGFACKAESNVTASDFFFSGIAKPAVINNTVGSQVTTANVEKIPGLNTLGVSLARIDYKPGGLNPPHTHPRATEVIFVLDGELDVAFITTSNKLISKKIKKGEVFVFPIGLVHYQKNNGDKLASVISAFNSQLPGTLSIAASLFSSKPAVPDGVLAKAFQIDASEVGAIKTKFAAPKKG
ncbi:Germin-like protein subfamily 2 member 4 [Stylosanthes scabra]|uniref:Germin-like protein n=1 Tax=Stylosanthes scabra TaxID=79078 RepID=A0ABU6TGF0_9FABA|nr:Germin-like protein subfamily 2 member 4 [Stylosanthes scabra]